MKNSCTEVKLLFVLATYLVLHKKILIITGDVGSRSERRASNGARWGEREPGLVCLGRLVLRPHSNGSKWVFQNIIH